VDRERRQILAAIQAFFGLADEEPTS